jgi:P2-related tail formation protein
MKTTVDIPDDMLIELIEHTEARTKREAILTAIEEYNRKKKIAALADVVGTFDQFMTTDELSQSRDSG